mgnify:CR=1 FL=1
MREASSPCARVHASVRSRSIVRRSFPFLLASICVLLLVTLAACSDGDTPPSADEQAQRGAELERELAALEATLAEREDASELEAIRSELEARKTLIKSLRADADRVTALEAQLEEKREIIGELEASINRHAETIAELKRLADMWKKKCQAQRGAADGEVTSARLPAFTETDVRALERLHAEAGKSPDRTIAIDMRQSLLEARRYAAAKGKE